MIKELKQRSIRYKGSYIGETEVIDTKTNMVYYVVVRIDDYMYKTFSSSYIDYITNKIALKPTEIEGDESIWFNYYQDDNETMFYHQYVNATKMLEDKKHQYYLNHKYSHIKKPYGNIKYEIIDKKTKDVFSCGPIGSVYELTIKLIDNSIIYVYANDWNYYAICDFSSFEEDENDGFPIEYIEDFKNAKKSKYYDLYLEMEKYIDNY